MLRFLEALPLRVGRRATEQAMILAVSTDLPLLAQARGEPRIAKCEVGREEEGATNIPPRAASRAHDPHC